jgi:hypothetical protein
MTALLFGEGWLCKVTRCEAALLNLLFSFDLLAKSPSCAAAISKAALPINNDFSW